MTTVGQFQNIRHVFKVDHHMLIGEGTEIETTRSLTTKWNG